MSDDRDFDPRFHPAYQRGYEGVVDAAAAPSRPAPHAAPPLPAQGPAAAPAPHAPAAALVDDPADTPSRKANPFVITLVVISAALLGGGLYLVVSIRRLFADVQGSTSFDYVTLQVLIGIAPIAIGLGVATALGVLFVYAVRWGREAR
ncbi:hypothetical protein BH11ACT4_BH11ACT4_15670 [soil metagenome]